MELTIKIYLPCNSVSMVLLIKSTKVKNILLLSLKSLKFVPIQKVPIVELIGGSTCQHTTVKLDPVPNVIMCRHTHQKPGFRLLVVTYKNKISEVLQP